MAGGGSRVIVRFLGEDSDLARALERLQAKARRFGDSFAEVTGRSGKFAAALKIAQAAVISTATAATAAQQAESAASDAAAKAATALTAAVGKAADAIGKVRVAETALAELRSRGNATAHQLAQAEERLSTAQRRQAATADAVAEAQRRVERSQRELARTRVASVEAVERHRRALAELEEANRRNDRANGRLARSLGAIRDGLASLAGGALSAAGTGLQFMAKWGLIVAAAMPLVGAALAVATAGIGALAFGAGAVILGLDGIKKAAGVMGPALDKLKASVSGVFEKNLTPIFRDLAGILPKVQGGFDRVAAAVASIAKPLTDFLKSEPGLRLVNSALESSANFVGQLGDGLKGFIDGFLVAMEAAGPQMTQLGKAISDLLTAVGDGFKKAAADGSFQRALQLGIYMVEGLAAVLPTLIDWLFRAAGAVMSFGQNSILFFFDALDAGLSFASGVLGAFSAVIGGIHNVAAALARVPGPWQSTFQLMADATGRSTREIDRMRGSVDQMHSKTIDAKAKVEGQFALDNLISSIRWIPSYKLSTVEVRARYTGFGALGGPSLVAAAHGRAVGGTVNKGQTYLVGERGPEYLTMPGSGYVTPHHRIGGGDSGGGSSRTVEFTGNIDQIFATYFMQLVRSGKVKIA